MLGADGKPAIVLDKLRCWLQPTDLVQSCCCVLMEPGCLGDGLPTQTLAIDPGHPMCLRSEFPALRPAKTFAATKGCSIVPWTELDGILPAPHWRYDLVLDPLSCGAYIANGVAVMSRRARTAPGYDYDLLQ